MDYLLLIIFTTFSGISAQSYCSVRGCCPNRDDECIMPIGRGHCYCDYFCSEDRSKLKNYDCCPDYTDTCIPRQTLPNNTCYDRAEDRYYKEDDEFLMDCHACVCHRNGRDMHIMCDHDECVSDDSVIFEVNRDKRGWIASKQEYFKSVKLSSVFGQSLGTRNFRRQVEKMHGKNVVIDIKSIPKFFDAREQWPGSIGGPEDQGKCGASWAFSTASVASDRWSIASKGKFLDRLSTRQLLICNKANFKCQGGFVTRAWKFIKNYGLLPQNCLTWDSIHGRTCPLTIKSSRKTNENYCPDKGINVQVRRMSPPYRIQGETHIMHEILTNGPVQATMIVYRDLFVYKSGIYSCSTKNKNLKGFHSVKIIGWGQASNGQKYWLCVNWWGKTWGENGYFRIIRGDDECKIESFIVGAYAQGDSNRLSPFFDRRR